MWLICRTFFSLICVQCKKGKEVEAEEEEEEKKRLRKKEKGSMKLRYG
jgi:hypothetical protein